MRERSWTPWLRGRAGRVASHAEREAFAYRIATPLRAPVATDPTLAARVMQAIRDDARSAADAATAATRRAWWRRSVDVRVTPLRGLAIAAGLAALYVGAGLVSPRAREGSESPVAAAASRDTVHVVRFVLVAPGASSVAVVGDFNRWKLDANPLAPTAAAGVWSTTVALPIGRHEYVFVVDGKQWVADPTAASRIADEFGVESSAITVGRLDPLRTS